MFASSWAFAVASVTFWKVTLCGPPDTMTNFTASPCFTVRLAGSNLYPVASPIILTSCVCPVAGAAAAAPAAGAPVAGAAVAVAGGSVLGGVVAAGRGRGSRRGGVGGGCLLAAAGAEDGRTRKERNTVEPHFLGPPVEPDRGEM